MGQALHKRATTAHEIINNIRQEQGTINSIANKYNIAYYTAKKWQSHDSVTDKPMGNKRVNATLSIDED